MHSLQKMLSRDIGIEELNPQTYNRRFTSRRNLLSNFLIGFITSLINGCSNFRRGQLLWSGEVNSPDQMHQMRRSPNSIQSSPNCFGRPLMVRGFPGILGFRPIFRNPHRRQRKGGGPIFAEERRSLHRLQKAAEQGRGGGERLEIFGSLLSHGVISCYSFHLTWLHS